MTQKQQRQRKLKYMYYYHINKRAIKWATYGAILCLLVGFILWLNVELYARDLILLNIY